MSATLIIIGVTALISIYAFSNPEFLNKFKHLPYFEVRDKSFYRMVSSGFLHGSYTHLLINMFVLYFFGLHVEQYYMIYFGPTTGTILFVVMYLLTIIAGDVPSLLKHKDNPAYASIGASGAVSGVLFTSAIIAPWNTVYLYAIIPMPAIIAAVGYLGYSQWAAKNSSDNIDHDAHFYGALFSVLFTIIIHPVIVSDFLSQIMGN